MTDARLPDRDTSQVDALVADRYIDALLAEADDRGPGTGDDATLARDVRRAAEVLRRSLVRVHPSFRFEERLAARLADLAAIQAQPAAVAGARGAVIPFPAGAGSLADPDLDAILRGDIDPSGPEAQDRPADRRPLLVTGAISTAALSIAGVAWVAWRASRPQGRGALGRAARQARARRAAAIAGLGGPA